MFLNPSLGGPELELEIVDYFGQILESSMYRPVKCEFRQLGEQDFILVCRHGTAVRHGAFGQERGRTRAGGWGWMFREKHWVVYYYR